MKQTYLAATLKYEMSSRYPNDYQGELIKSHSDNLLEAWEQVYIISDVLKP